MDGVYIPSLDGKDIYISNHLADPPPDYGGFTLLSSDGTVNIKRFINTLDYSLDLIALREVYQSTYRNKYFSFFVKDKEYTTRCINVTFKYSNKEFNQFGPNLYIKFGYQPSDITLEDCVCVRNGELIAVKTETPVQQDKVVSEDILQKYFRYKNGVYKIRRNLTLNTVAQIRNELYNNGFYCDGIHYVRFKRSSGSSRVGKCLFIDEKLYAKMHRYEMLGLKIRKGQPVDLAALEAYISLTLSSIIDTIQIQPENILVIQDYDSIFKDKVAATTLNGKSLKTKPDTVTISNSIWDGQSLIDVSIMGKYAIYGMILLRNHFFKSCCFNTNIQQFFEMNNISDISQLNGFTLAKNVSDIKLITTPNSIKFLKFGTIEEWMSRIGSTFGVVKHEKKTHFFEGRMVQTHYQLINTLQMTREEVEEFLKPTFEYMDLLKTDPAVMRYHIHYPESHRLTNTPVKSKDEIVFRLLGLTDKFAQTKYYHEFRKKTLDAFRNNLRYGHVLVEGNYSTLFGNPMEMLYQSIGKFDGESLLGIGNVHSKRFEYGAKLLGSRSPHVTVSNILLCKNVASDEIDKYFNLTPEIVCINSIGENILQRLNGADYDSDSLLLTDNKLLVEVAERNYHNFLVPTNFVESTKIKRPYTADQKADLDIKTSVNKIGEIINLSQKLQTYMWHQINNGASYEDVHDLFMDICQLAVMSNLEIDAAKKEFAFTNADELEKLRIKWDRKDADGRTIEPYFFGHVAKDKGYFNDKRKNYLPQDTSMDYLEETIDKYHSPGIRGKKLSFSDILNFEEYDRNIVNYDHAKTILTAIRALKSTSSALFQSDNDSIDSETKHRFYEDKKKELIEYINKEVSPNVHTMYFLLRKIDSEEYSDLQGYLIDILFNIGNDAAFELIQNAKDTIGYLVPDSSGDIDIYGYRYAKTYKK